MQNIDLSFEDFKNKIIEDYKLANLSRQASLLGRREVLNGKAKFGIFGAGKEVPQIVLSKFFQKGDWRSGYYRDQTFMMAIGELTIEQFFAQLYGDTDPNNNPFNQGRLMNNHFATATVDENGEWLNHMVKYNSSSDISPTAGQMPRLLGLAYASKLYRNLDELKSKKNFSNNGNEVAFGMIGDASTSEGHFFETMNAAGVLQVPLAMTVWDDGYGISVPKKMQTTKSSISDLFEGFQRNNKQNGFEIFKAKGWDYSELFRVFENGINLCRKEHVPVLFHIEELTQPQGHSTSGSHERYKSKERLEWEKEYDCIYQMRKWILEKGISTDEELIQIEKESEEIVVQAKEKAYKAKTHSLAIKRDDLVTLIENSGCNCPSWGKVNSVVDELKKVTYPNRKDSISSAKKILRHICKSCNSKKPLKANLLQWLELALIEGKEKYSTHLYSESQYSALKIKGIDAEFNEEIFVPGFDLLRKNFDNLFRKYPELHTFGEDTGSIGDVNQGLAGLQDKYGPLRISDTGIREATILGQGIGCALRGLRPIAEIQYFDYLLYALQTISDDLATLQYRTSGRQKSPLIIRTRGHRLEGIWHSGSPLSMVINSIRGVYVIVPRNLTQAAGFYNTLMESDDSALVVEPLNAYRLKEKLPSNLNEFKVELGKPEILIEGSDITIVTYGSCVRIAQDAIQQLSEIGISCELIDVQTLLPFDRFGIIKESIKKTNKVLFFDEDVPGGATAYMLVEVLEKQDAYKYLDSKPITLTGMNHRPAYGTDGDYFSNPSAEDVFDEVYKIMGEYLPEKYPPIYK